MRQQIIQTLRRRKGTVECSGQAPGWRGLLFAISYRVKVTGVAGDTVKLFPGQFIYNNGTADVPLTATPFNILISNPLNFLPTVSG